MTVTQDLLPFASLGWLCLGIIAAGVRRARRPTSFETLGRVFMPARDRQRVPPARWPIGLTAEPNESETPGCREANWTPDLAWSLLESCDTGAALDGAALPVRRPSR
jgi:hypothetical protein